MFLYLLLHCSLPSLAPNASSYRLPVIFILPYSGTFNYDKLRSLYFLADGRLKYALLLLE
jgi:hypothetical protein